MLNRKEQKHMENNNWNWYENATPNVGNNTQQPAGNNFSGNYGESGNQGSRGKKSVSMLLHGPSSSFACW